MTTKECVAMRSDLNEIVPDNMQVGIFYLDDGRMIVIDSQGTVIKPHQECDLFPLCDVKEVEKIECTTTVTVRGSHYKVKRIGDQYYKIPLPH